MNSMKFTSSPWGFRKTPFEEQLKWLSSNGINYYCGQFFAEEPGLFDPDITDDEISRAIKLIDSYGMKCASFNVNGDFMVDNIEAEIFKCCGEINRAAAFSPQVLIVFAGWQNRSDNMIFKQVSSALKRVAAYAAKYGLRVALENHGGLTRTAEQINHILDGVNEPNIGINYDPANFLMYGEDPLESLKNLKHQVIFTHFKSLKYVDGKKEYCRISEGQIDYKPILEVLSQLNYDGFYAIEYEEPRDVFEGSCDDLNALKELLDVH